MKFRAIEKIRFRATPGLKGSIIGSIDKDTVVESDEYEWKHVTLPDGREGYCAAGYLEKILDAPQTQSRDTKWHPPIRADKFIVYQEFLAPDPETYPKTGHHPGVDYRTKGEDNVPLYFCTDGEVIESGSHKQFGNYFFFYVPKADRTFVYFHLRDAAPRKGNYKGGEQCGVTGNTGLSTGIHLHLECIRGRVTSVDRGRLYISKDALISAAEDADVFIRTRL